MCVRAWQTVAASWGAYWLVLVVLKWWMQSRPAFEGVWARRLYALHYLVLTAWSLVMFVGLAVAMAATAAEGGWRALFCGQAAADGKGALQFWLCAWPWIGVPHASVGVPAHISPLFALAHRRLLVGGSGACLPCRPWLSHSGFRAVV